MLLKKFDQTNIDKDLKKNKPKVLWPIISSFISLILIILITVVKGFSKEMFSWPEYIIFVLILILLPLASWLGSYFVKKQKTDNLNDYVEETNIVVDFIKETKNFKHIKCENKEIKFNFEKCDELTNEIIYNEKERSFKNIDNTLIYISIGIGLILLEINPENNQIINICGKLASSIMLNKKLKFNNVNSIKSKVYIETTHKVSPKTIMDHHSYDDIFYDSKKRLVCIGDKKIYNIDDIIEFIPNGYLVLRDNELVSIFIYI